MLLIGVELPRAFCFDFETADCRPTTQAKAAIFQFAVKKNSPLGDVFPPSTPSVVKVVHFRWVFQTIVGVTKDKLVSGLPQS